MAVSTCTSCGRRFERVGFVAQVLTDNAGSAWCPDCVRQNQSDDRRLQDSRAQTVAAQAAAQATIESQSRQAQAAEFLAHKQGMAAVRVAEAQAEAALAASIATMDDDGLRRYQSQKETESVRKVLDEAASEVAMAAEVVASSGLSYGGRIVDPYAEHNKPNKVSTDSNDTSVANPIANAISALGDANKPTNAKRGLASVHAWANIEQAHGNLSRICERLRTLPLIEARADISDHRSHLVSTATEIVGQLAVLRTQYAARARSETVSRCVLRRSIILILICTLACGSLVAWLTYVANGGSSWFLVVMVGWVGTLAWASEPSPDWGVLPDNWAAIENQAGQLGILSSPPWFRPAAIVAASVIGLGTVSWAVYHTYGPSRSESASLAPPVLYGEYVRRGASEYDQERLVITPTGIGSTGAICASSLSWNSFTETSPNSWLFTCSPPASIGSGTTSGGSLTLMPDGSILISVQNDEESDCFDQSLSGAFVSAVESIIDGGHPDGEDVSDGGPKAHD